MDKLLYIKSSKGVVNDEFYLSPYHTSQSELNTTLELLRSDDAHEIACNFPARYIYISQHFRVPNQDLQSCQGLQEFMSTFGHDKLYLSFSSEYINNPASAFGHIMMVFRDETQPLELASAVHFAARTGAFGGFSYLKKGLVGDFDSYFVHEAFFRKIYRYNTLEQRYMYLYELDFTHDDITMLLYHLYELRKAQFKYYFLNQNCASRTSDFLNIITKNKTKTKLYYLPIDTLKAFKSHIVSTTKLVPLINKLDYTFNQLTKEQKNKFEYIIETHTEPKEDISDILKQALQYYNVFYFKKFNKSYKNYDSIMNLNYKPISIKDTMPDPLSRTLPSDIVLGMRGNRGVLEYRPLFLGIDDILSSEASLRIFDTSLSFDESWYLDELVALELRSMPIQKVYYSSPSFGLYSGLRRNNKSNTIKWDNEIGIGSTVGTRRFTLNYMFSLGISNLDLYLKPSLYTSFYILDNLKIALDSFVEFGFDETYFENDLFVSYKNTVLYNIGITHSNKIDKYEFYFRIKYNF